MVNVARDERIDKGIDRLARADTIANVGGGNGHGFVFGVDDAIGGKVADGIAARTAAGQNDESRELEQPLRILPIEQLRDVVLADNPIECSRRKQRTEMFE